MSVELILENLYLHLDQWQDLTDIGDWNQNDRADSFSCDDAVVDSGAW